MNPAAELDRSLWYRVVNLSCRVNPPATTPFWNKSTCTFQPSPSPTSAPWSFPCTQPNPCSYAAWKEPTLVWLWDARCACDCNPPWSFKGEINAATLDAESTKTPSDASSASLPCYEVKGFGNFSYNPDAKSNFVLMDWPQLWIRHHTSLCG